MAVRLAVSLAVLLLVFTAAFFLMRLAPGGPFARLEQRPAAVEESLRERFQLDRPVLVQYFSALAGYVRGEFGPSVSFAPGRSVAEVLAAALPVSLTLGALALFLALLVGVPLGVWTGLHPGGIRDRLVSLCMLLVLSASVIVVGGMLRAWLVVEWRWFKLGGFDSLANGTLPVLTLGLAYGAILQRLVRANVAAQCAGELPAAVRARGVSPGLVAWKYVVPLALLPMLEYMGPVIAGILTGSFVVETIFEVPGVAACFVQGAAARDYPLVSASIMVYAVLLVAANLLFETLHAALDPRERGRQAGRGA